MTDYVQLNNEMIALSKQLAQATPGVMGAFGQLKKEAIADGVLSGKQKELIALALGVGAQCEPCIAFHAQQCNKYGVSREEVVEMLGVCMLMGGGPKMQYAAKALAAFDAFAQA